MSLSERLSKLMDEKEITAYKLSKNTGIAQSTLSEVLNNKNKTLSIANLSKIADYFGVSTEYLLGISPFRTASETKYSITVAVMKKLLTDEEYVLFGYDDLVWHSAEDNAELIYGDEALEVIKELRKKQELTDVEYYKLGNFIIGALSWPDDFNGPVSFVLYGKKVSCPIDYWAIPKIHHFDGYFNEPVFEFTIFEPEENRVKSRQSFLTTLEFEADYLIRIPLVGRVAAGNPILAIENSDEYIIIDTRINRVNENSLNEYFALEVSGHSMEPTIHDGEIVLVRRQPIIELGEIGVFRCNNDEATIKRFAKEGSKVYLIPDNKQFPVQEYTQDCVCIGKVLQSIRRSIK